MQCSNIAFKLIEDRIFVWDTLIFRNFSPLHKYSNRVENQFGTINWNKVARWNSRQKADNIT